MQINPKPTLNNLGGKGYHLHLLKNICTVPEFFVIKFDSLDEVNDKTIQTQILEEFAKQNFELVSVRSSATVEDGASSSFAGMFETVLNVEKEKLIESIKQVVDSVGNERVKQYCKLKGIDYDKVGMRVVVQKMINSEVSGVCFTKTFDTDESITVEACLGLGEALVSGKVTPDNYSINRNTLEIENKSVAFQKTILSRNGYEPVLSHKANTQKLSDDDIRKLAETSLLIEKSLNFKAADIEWAFENERLYILQARAVTGLSSVPQTDPKNVELTERYSWTKLVSRRSPPLWRSLESKGFTKENFIKHIGVDCYLPLKGDEYCIYKNQEYFTKVLARLKEHAKDLNYYDEISKISYRMCDDHIAFAHKYRDTDFSKFSDNELKTLFEDYIERHLETVTIRTPVLMLDNILQESIAEEIEKIKAGGKEVDFQYELITSTRDLPFVAMQKSMLEISAEMEQTGLDDSSSQIKSLIEKHIENHGWLTTHRYLGKPLTTEEVITSIKENFGTAAQKLQEMKHKKQQRDQNLESIKSINPRIKRLLDIAQEYAHMRTYRIDVVIEGDFYLRPFFTEIAKRIGLDYFEFPYLTDDEIVAALDGKTNSLEELVRKRKEYFVNFLDENDFYIFEGLENKIEKSNAYTKIATLGGKVAYKGYVSGTVKVLLHKSEIHKVNPGDILVCPMTTPEMVVGLLKCSGIITDEGGIASHAAQISREFKIPCIMGTAVATTVLKDNDTVELIAEGLEGIVKLISSSVSLPDINNYELTFEVAGLGFLFADMLTYSFDYMHPLFTISNGEFKQYFHNDKMDWAGKYGLKWLSKKNGFDEYEVEYKDFYNKNFGRLAKIASGKLAKNDTKIFFEVANKFHWYYSKMNTQFSNHITDTALKSKGSVIASNLEKLSKFKDVAREWINQILVYENCHLNILLQNLSKQFGISVENLNNYKSAEIYDLFDGNKVDQKELDDRQFALVYFDSKKIEYISGETAKGFVDSAGQLPNTESELKGQVANNASQKQVEGIVRIINVDYANIDAMNAEIAKMEKGEILVAKFTAPELLAACAKAKAIITDLGGILSHAAIVARELNIPCIVGTRNATKLLKNGNTIKVNLVSGEILTE